MHRFNRDIAEDLMLYGESVKPVDRARNVNFDKIWSAQDIEIELEYCWAKDDNICNTYRFVVRLLEAQIPIQTLNSLRNLPSNRHNRRMELRVPLRYIVSY